MVGLVWWKQEGVESRWSGRSVPLSVVLEGRASLVFMSRFHSVSQLCVVLSKHHSLMCREAQAL